MKLPEFLLIAAVALPLAVQPAAAQDAVYSHFDLQLCFNWVSMAAQYAPDDDIIKRREAVMAAIDKANDTLEPGAETADRDYAMKAYNEWLAAYNAAVVEERVRLVTDAVGRAKACSESDASGALIAPAEEDDD